MWIRRQEWVDFQRDLREWKESVRNLREINILILDKLGLSEWTEPMTPAVPQKKVLITKEEFDKRTSEAKSLLQGMMQSPAFQQQQNAMRNYQSSLGQALGGIRDILSR